MNKHPSRRELLGGAAALATGLAAPQVWSQPSFMAPAKLRVGTTPYISAGPYMIAEAKGYFKKLNLEVDSKSFADGSLSLPSLAAGELDVAGATMGAGAFNLMAKGSGIRLVMERVREAPGVGSNAILVSNQLYEKGLTSLANFKLAKGIKIAEDARGSIAVYLYTLALEKAGLKTTDVDWQWGMDFTVAFPMMKKNMVDMYEFPLPGAHRAQKQGVGRIIGWSDEIAPNMVLMCNAAHPKTLAAGHSALVRFCMAILQANKEFMAASQNGDPEILKILAEGTGLPAELINEVRPRWSHMSADGLPNIASVMSQQAFWHEKTDLLVKTTPEAQMFDLRAVREANQRLAEKNPFV